MGPDLSTMYQNGMGASASYMGGQMFSADQAQQAEKLKAMQLENAQSATMNPLNAQFKQGQINQQAAELPGIVGQSQSLGAKGQEDVATMSAKIATKFSDMSTQIGENGMKQMASDGEKLSQASQIMKQYPPALQKQVLTKAIQQYGGNPNSPMFQGLLQAPDEMVQTAAESLGKGMALAGSKYTEASATATAHGQVQKDIAKGNNDTQIKVAEIAAKSREHAADARSKAATSHMNMDQKVAYLESIPTEERTPAEQSALVSIKTQLLQQRAAGANAVAPNMLGQANPLDAAAAAARGTSNASTGSGPDFAAIAKKQGQVYDPANYDYKVDASGQLLRKPK